MGITIEDAVDRAIEHLIDLESLDDIFRPPFLAVPIEWTYLKAENLVGSMRNDAVKFLKQKKINALQSPEKFNIPKSRYAYRHGSLIDASDLIKYTALVLILSDAIELNRIPESEGVVFSYRLKKTGPKFLSTNTIDEFRKASSNHSKDVKFQVKIEADISNFYDRLNLHKLESVLAQIGCDPSYVKLLNDFLLYWAGRNSFGLPVGSDASRLLAEASLINVDNALRADGITFVRYVDDMRLFATSYAEAHSQLNRLVSLLDREGLFLNTLKTKILSIKKNDGTSGDSGEKEDSPHHDGFIKIDITEKIPAFVATGGKYPKISKTYKEPGKEAVKELQKVDLDELLNVILNNEVTETALRSFVKAFIYKEHKDPLLIFEIIYRYIHMCGYVVDALIKEHHRFSKEERQEIAKKFIDFYFKTGKSEYYNLMIIRLLSIESFYSKGFFTDAIKSMPVTVNPVYFQQFVLMSAQALTRPEFLTLKDIYTSQHLFVRRAIFYAFMKAESILSSEKKAWAKTLAKSEKDDLLKRQAANIGFNGALEEDPPTDSAQTAG